MLIRTVLIRFYRSFNYDYLRKSHPSASPRGPWEILSDGSWYPFVEIPLQTDITAVVGANEAGKSQLLTAVRHALTGKEISQRDHCRYSKFFAVNRRMSFPDFGFCLTGLTTEEQAVVRSTSNIDEQIEFDEFRMFRIDGAPPVVYLHSKGDEYSRHEVQDVDALEDSLPRIFDIDSDAPLPDSVPISYLASNSVVPYFAERTSRQPVMQALDDNAESWFGSAELVQSSAGAIYAAIKSIEGPSDRRRREYDLARELLMTVAKVDQSAFKQLQEALRRGADGHANGIVSQINQALAKNLNFPKYWSQDSDFALLVTLRDLDLVFTIHDRTGTEYSFAERSGGLRYFLSYFVQALAHKSARPSSGEILLMDEPDAYLSSSGQQDLLRIFQDFALAHDSEHSQVLYVTHSPFLIDKNHSERIRVLDKGEGDEGTRVVSNAARNHYEPLRSAFGSFVGETTFISNCNLLLEGMSDQVLLAGLSAHLQKSQTPSTQYLNLNEITLVPAGSASQVAYMAYLALGRDANSPAVIALLDSDDAGNRAKAALGRGPGGKQILSSSFILQIGDLPKEQVVCQRNGGPLEIEDLFPLDMAVAAGKRYVCDLIGPDRHERVKDLKTTPGSTSERSTHEIVEDLLSSTLGDDFHLDKFGFARSLLAEISESDSRASLKILEENFRQLFSALNRIQRNANVNALREKVGSRVKRTKKTFFMDNPHSSTREQGALLLDDMERHLDDSPLADDWRIEMRKVRRQFSLDEEIVTLITEYERFQEAIDGIVYFDIRASSTEAAELPEDSTVKPKSAGPAAPRKQAARTRTRPDADSPKTPRASPRRRQS
jgi:predicted ATP-dependent endonuclease of OLD family